MRAVIQRVLSASVKVNGEIVGKINHGLLVFIGIEDPDTLEDLNWLSNKITRLRIFNDDQQVMNLSVNDVKGEILLVSQFTLMASTQKGNRPSYSRSSKSEFAKPLYLKFADTLSQQLGKTVKTGIFGANMQVELLNDGPVTLIIDTKNKE